MHHSPFFMPTTDASRAIALENSIPNICHPERVKQVLGRVIQGSEGSWDQQSVSRTRSRSLVNLCSSA